jgi:hypothetical protein
MPSTTVPRPASTPRDRRAVLPPSSGVPTIALPCFLGQLCMPTAAMPSCLVQLRLTCDRRALPCSPSSRPCVSVRRHPRRFQLGARGNPSWLGLELAAKPFVTSPTSYMARCLQFASVTGVKEEMPSKLLGKIWPSASCGDGGHDGAINSDPVKPKNGQNSHLVWQVRPPNLSSHKFC